MRYGAIPVVADTGGLRDTVTPAVRDSGTGFLFQPGSAQGFLGAIEEALTPSTARKVGEWGAQVGGKNLARRDERGQHRDQLWL